MLLLSIQPKLSLQYKIINSANIKKTKPIIDIGCFFILAYKLIIKYKIVISPRAAVLAFDFASDQYSYPRTNN